MSKHRTIWISIIVFTCFSGNRLMRLLDRKVVMLTDISAKVILYAKFFLRQFTCLFAKSAKYSLSPFPFSCLDLLLCGSSSHHCFFKRILFNYVYLRFTSGFVWNLCHLNIASFILYSITILQNCLQHLRLLKTYRFFVMRIVEWRWWNI